MKNGRVIFRKEYWPRWNDTVYLAVFPDEPAHPGRYGYVAMRFDDDMVWFEPYGEMVFDYYYRHTKPVHAKTEEARRCLTALENRYHTEFDVRERISYARRKFTLKNYKPILLDANWPDVEEMVSDAAQRITYRLYNGGNSIDHCRKTIPFERTMLESVMLGALQAIMWRDDAAQTALDTAEFTIDYLLHGVNGYDSVYLPILRILRELDPETKEENAC